jgi:hypothetical protein
MRPDNSDPYKFQSQLTRNLAPVFVVPGIYLIRNLCASCVHFVCILCAILAQIVHSYCTDSAQMVHRY